MQIRPYQPGDEKEILELDWLLFPDPWNKRNLSNWQWRYRGNNPAGQSLIYVMEHEGKVIAHFAVVPYRLRVFGKDTLGSHSIGSIVAPEYQGKGLIKFVADALFKEAVEKGIVFSYGFPNILAYDLHKKFMRYNDVAQVYTMERESNFDTIKKDRYAANKFNFFPINRFDAAVDLLWDEAKDTYKISVIRDAAFLNWRYLDRPDQKYYAFGAYADQRLLGYIVLKLYRDDKILKGHIVDIFSLPRHPDAALFLIDKSEKFFRENKTDIESAWVLGSDLYNNILLDKGLKPLRPRPLICRLNFNQEDYSSTLDGANWYFTMGDSTEIF